MSNQEATSQGRAGGKKSNFKQTLVLLVLILVVVILSIGGTLYVSGTLTGDRFGSSSRVNKTMSLLDAQLMCEGKARQELGRRIKNISVDNHSTRYDDFDDRFKIFMEADLYADAKRQGFTKFYYINCYTRSDREVVTTFELSEDEEFKAKAIRKQKGGTFGI